MKTEDERDLSYLYKVIPVTSFGLYDNCICPRCKVKLPNDNNIPCLLINCPICKGPMMGELT